LATAHGWQMSPGRVLVLDRPRIMAILNVTPDSFSDGGVLSSPEHALRAAEVAIEAGADGLDVGGESTRPGAIGVSAAEQIRRVVPAIEIIRASLGDRFFITVDTTQSETARAAFGAGADALNDVSACTADDGMLPLIASQRRGVVLMHRLAIPERDRYSTDYAALPQYSGGVVSAVRMYLAERVSCALAAGVPREGIVIDPGLGFGKGVEQNLELIRAAPELLEFGLPLLSALSRKSFVAAAAGISPGRPASERAHATVGMSVMHMTLGARLFRVHDVAAHAHALRAAWGVMGA
jgi:dihydropteroate synthase